jgi:predicted site-specific integrase-resolvase
MARPDESLTLARAARRSQLSVPTLWRAVRSGELHNKGGLRGPIQVSAAELELFCARRARAARPKSRGWLTIYQAARLINVAPSTVWRWMHLGRLRYRTIRGQWMVSAQVLRSFDLRRRADRE